VRFSNRTLTAHAPIELSLVDQKWGSLFDERGPTKRLGEFLRGLANHMLSLVKSDYRIYTYDKQMIELQPKSIVITPATMAIFYSTFSTNREHYPLHCIYPHPDSLLSNNTS
jgi:hypothetical protein